jgi:hypothetical protein
MQFVALCDYLITIAPTDAGISCMEAGCRRPGGRNLADAMLNNFLAIWYLMRQSI